MTQARLWAHPMREPGYWRSKARTSRSWRSASNEWSDPCPHVVGMLAARLSSPPLVFVQPTRQAL